MELSIIIPIFNEKDNVRGLVEKVVGEVSKLGKSYELILIDDGSTDGSDAILDQMAKAHPSVRVIHFTRNFGQTTAMMAGLDYSTGDLIIPMDGDLQNDPKDIQRLLVKLNEGYDVVSGWRRSRKDHFFLRVFPSLAANKLISVVSGVPLHDYGCTLKIYRRSVIKNVKLYGEMHRFIPVYASWQGAKVSELEVTHHPRTANKSKYGLERMLKVLLDLFVLKFFGKYFQKPIYVFGGFGFLCLMFALLAGVTAVALKVYFGTSFILTPLPLLSVFSFLIGIQSFFTGLMAEVLMRTYYESQQKTTYQVKSITGV